MEFLRSFVVVLMFVISAQAESEFQSQQEEIKFFKMEVMDLTEIVGLLEYDTKQMCYAIATTDSTEYAYLKRKVSALTEIVDFLVKDPKHVCQVDDTTEQAIEDVLAEIAELKQENKELQEQHDLLSSENSDLGAENQILALFEKEAHDLKEDVGKLNEKIADLKKENGELSDTDGQQKEEIKYLNREVTKLTEKVGLLEQNPNEMCNGKTSTKPDDGWIDGLNGFQYALTSIDDWLTVKGDCEVMGGTLAATGIRNKNERIYIGKQLKIKKAWIGLSDRDEEGLYMWVDGVKATNKNINWAKDQPDGGSSENCGIIFQGKKKQFKAEDQACDIGMYGICEKPL